MSSRAEQPGSHIDENDADRGGRSVAVIAASCVIGSFLILQFVAGFKLVCPPRAWRSVAWLRIACPPKLWPFLDYPMYDGAHFPGERLVHYFVVGVYEDGGEQDLTPAALGIDDREYRQGLVDALIRADHDAAAGYVEPHREQHGRRLRALRLENRPMQLTTSGVSEGPIEVIRTLALDRRGR